MRQLMNDGAEALLIGSGDRSDRLYRIRMPSGGADSKVVGRPDQGKRGQRMQRSGNRHQ